MRIFLVHIRTGLKNRIHVTFAKYAIDFEEASDLFGVRGRNLIEKRVVELTPETRNSVKEQMGRGTKYFETLSDSGITYFKGIS